ncbi:MAG TPA: VOC family protein [Solirubrobacteraceae bacterium]|jgi:catechol 2,3-dioxygenase-like lactoylglutathione lyase family enzyme
MTDSTQSRTTITNLGVVMFTIADQDEALRYYTEKLGFEVRSDTRFGEGDAMRWLEVAPPGSNARIALNEPMGGGAPGGGSIGVETNDVRGEHQRLKGLGDVDVDADLMDAPGAPTMFCLRDPDGNHIWVVETP